MTASITDTLDHLEAVLADAVIDDKDAGIYRVNRRIFTDAEIFDLEMKYIFEGNWIYLAHESQIPNPGDYFTTYMGRSPVVITRDKDGELHCLINACAHRGAMLCRRKTDNRMTFTCPFHGWTFRNDGTLLKVKKPEGADYPPAFDVNGSHNLTKVARFDSYRGFLFGSLNPDVASLAEYLGDSTKVIDLLVDQSPEGLEVLRGTSTYTLHGNWKVQIENGADGYHVSSVHWNYAATTSRRLGQVGRRLLGVPARAHVPVDLGGQPAGPAAVGAGRAPEGDAR
jgi:benzoate/toluate 1,2-dioxygenase subunit alpha